MEFSIIAAERTLQGYLRIHRTRIRMKQVVQRQIQIPFFRKIQIFYSLWILFCINFHFLKYCIKIALLNFVPKDCLTHLALNDRTRQEKSGGKGDELQSFTLQHKLEESSESGRESGFLRNLVLFTLHCLGDCPVSSYLARKI